MTEKSTVESKPERKHRQWEAHIENWQKSALSQVAYCREHGLKYHQFTYWKKRVQQENGDIAFVPLRLSQNLPAVINSSRIELITPNGYKLELSGNFDQTVVRQLLHTVRSL